MCCKEHFIFLALLLYAVHITQNRHRRDNVYVKVSASSGDTRSGIVKMTRRLNAFSATMRVKVCCWFNKKKSEIKITKY